MRLDMIYPKEWESEKCYCCESKITNETKMTFLRIYTTKQGNINTFCYAVCILCNMQECAILEADDEKRRYTKVGVYKSDQFMYGCLDRCGCGRASYGTRNSECVICRRERNMLKKSEFGIRQLKKYQTQMNKLIKEIQNGTK